MLREILKNKKVTDFIGEQGEDLFTAIKDKIQQTNLSTKKEEALNTLKKGSELEKRNVLDLATQQQIKTNELLAVKQKYKEAIQAQKNNIDFVNKYAKNDSKFGTEINTWDDYLKVIDDNIDREAMILKDQAGYRDTSDEYRKDVARTILLKMAKNDYLDRRLYMEHGGKNLSGADDGRYTQNIPKELEIQENFNVYADNLMANKENYVFPFKGKDGLIYRNKNEIDKVKKLEKKEIEDAQKLQFEIEATRKATLDQAQLSSGKYGDPTMKPRFDIGGYTSYKNKVFNRLKRGVYVQRDFNFQPILDDKGNVKVLDWDKSSDLIEIDSQRNIEKRSGDSLIYIQPKIPNLQKGHELMKVRREQLLANSDDVNLKQITYPTFFTTEPRNKIHIKLETDLSNVLDEIKSLSSGLLLKSGSKDRIRILENTRKAIEKDMKTLGLESRILNEATGKFRQYGQAFNDAGQLINSLKGIKAFQYIGSDLDIGTGKLNKNIVQVDGVFALPDGFEDGGFASFEEVLEYDNG